MKKSSYYDSRKIFWMIKIERVIGTSKCSDTEKQSVFALHNSDVRCLIVFNQINR